MPVAESSRLSVFSSDLWSPIFSPEKSSRQLFNQVVEGENTPESNDQLAISTGFSGSFLSRKMADRLQTDAKEFLLQDSRAEREHEGAIDLVFAFDDWEFPRWNL